MHPSGNLSCMFLLHPVDLLTHGLTCYSIDGYNSLGGTRPAFAVHGVYTSFGLVFFVSSLMMGMLSTAESTTSLNPVIFAPIGVELAFLYLMLLNEIWSFSFVDVSMNVCGSI
ncbi:hypothetical protein ACJX0J_028484 [Zea mays]